VEMPANKNAKIRGLYMIQSPVWKEGNHSLIPGYAKPVKSLPFWHTER
jgi:hypothetical protein